jgi:hypothetical protein
MPCLDSLTFYDSMVGTLAMPVLGGVGLMVPSRLSSGQRR